MLVHEQLRSQVSKLHTTEYSWENFPEPMQSLPKSAILIPLVVEDDTINVWLTKRSDLVSAYKGDVCFPGGKKDASDANAVETALREAREEIGLDASEVEVIGELIPKITLYRIIMSPIVGIVSNDFHPKPNAEVSLAFKLPLERFLSTSNHWTSVYETENYKDYVHFFNDTPYGQNVTTFGLTATLAIELACGVFGRVPDFPLSLNGAITPEDPFHLSRLQMQKFKNMLTYEKSHL